MNKDEVVADARRMMEQRFPGVKDNKAVCLYLAIGAVVAAEKQGIRLVLQAGSCFWPRVTPETDDGTEPNVFGYQWDPDGPLSKLAMKLDEMPEMHVWAGDPVKQEIVDLSTGCFPDQCLKMLGCRWKAPRPPEYFWGPFSELPPLASYQPNEEATMLAVELFKRSLREAKGGV